MYAPTHGTTRSGSEQAAQPHVSHLVAKWAQGRRRITPWAYPYLRALGALRLTLGILLAVAAGLVMSRGYGTYAAILLAGAALHLAIGSLDTAGARAAHPRT
jgi:hypothetical protein